LTQDAITIREVGLREGVQITKQPISLNQKIRLLNILYEAQLDLIEATAIVRTDLVPNHADWEEVLTYCASRSDPKKFTALYLNKKGFELLLQFPQLSKEPWLHTAVSEDFLIMNVNRSFSSESQYFEAMEHAFKQSGLDYVNIMLSTCFGSIHEGLNSVSRVMHRLEQLLNSIKLPVKELCLADTYGVCNPKLLRSILEELNCCKLAEKISLHLHNTNGLGLANALVGLESGVRTFDSSIAGVGGCPFIPQASGNIPTEELVLLARSSGFRVKVDSEKLALAVIEARNIFGHETHSHLALLNFDNLVHVLST